MLYLAGQPKTVSCLAHTVDATLAPQENVAMANIQMQSDALSHLCASFANDDHAGDPWSSLIKVIGTKGSTRYGYCDFVINDHGGARSQTYQCYPESIKNAVTHFVHLPFCSFFFLICSLNSGQALAPPLIFLVIIEK